MIELSIEHQPDRYLRSPRLVAQPDGTAILYVIAWQGATERVHSYRIEPSGQISGPSAGRERSAIPGLTRGDTVQETTDIREDLEETRDGHTLWVQHRGGIASVRLERPNKHPLVVYRARGTAMAPSLALAADGGVWIAFHTDVREDTGRADVAKWIALRYVDPAGKIWQPAALMPERDRMGIEQSFEFPAMATGADGALRLFGRGSHAFFRQDFTHAGAGERTCMANGGWGARGRQIAVAQLADHVITARREREGIRITIEPTPNGGAPELVRASIDAVVPRVVEAPASRAARRTRRDPARARGLFTAFGDLHQHTAHSDGLGTAHEAYLRARDHYHHDFVALTDHESFLGKRTGPGEWEYLQRVADSYAKPGRFATLLGYEWTGGAHPGPGHKCVYYPHRGLPIVSRDKVSSGRELVERIKALGGIAAPHHIGWTGADEEGHDELGQPIWEICSGHGCYEHAQHPLGQRGELQNQMIDRMLERGHRFGFTASSDSHGLLWHHGEARKRDPYRVGLTGVQVTRITREAILDALRARRCYATSGAKILLDVSADGQPMGSAFRDRDSAEFEVHAVGTETIRRIEVVGPAGVLARVESNAREAWLRARIGGQFAYARITQADGEMAWSSPVFMASGRAGARGRNGSD